MRIGVLALQGAFSEHICVLEKMGVETWQVRLPKDLEGLDGLIIPGGESTTIGKLAFLYNLTDPIKRFALKKAVWGTCAGMILMAKEAGADQPLFKVMDIVVERNAFGRQKDSFECPVEVDVFKCENGESGPFPAVFIRAPELIETKGDAGVIAKLPDGTPVGARQGKLLATAFHPELTEDRRFHRYFLNLARS